MILISCAFDKKSRPLVACVLDPKTNDANFYNLYHKGTGLSLFEVEQNISTIKDLLTNKFAVTDLKPFIKSFDLNTLESLEAYDINGNKIVPKEDISKTKKELIEDIKLLKQTNYCDWHRILANSKIVYHHLEKTGYALNGIKQDLKYDLTYSGRSRCLKHNIQGAKEEEVDLPVGHDVFLHFDWIAADLRIAALLSKDQDLEATFKKSDPYSEISKELKVSREECKKELLKCLYSMDIENPIIEIYPDLKAWMIKQSSKIDDFGYSESLLGRKFYFEDHRTKLSVFNASIQGSVAHAMQNLIYQVYKIYPDNLITEIHDSLVMSCSKKRMMRLASDVIRIMQYPFKEILNENPKFPLKLSIGNKWRKWKLYKEYY